MAEIIKKIINVGIAECHISSGQTILHTILGSCIGVCVWSKKKKIGGLVHIMLPASRPRLKNPCKYADTGIRLLISQLQEKEVKLKELTAKIAGGASMFQTNGVSFLGDIGKNNVDACKKVLNEYKIPIIAEDTGGTKGRTIDFHIDNGIVVIKVIKEGIRQI